MRQKSLEHPSLSKTSTHSILPQSIPLPEKTSNNTNEQPLKNQEAKPNIPSPDSPPKSFGKKTDKRNIAKPRATPRKPKKVKPAKPASIFDLENTPPVKKESSKTLDIDEL